MPCWKLKLSLSYDYFLAVAGAACLLVCGASLPSHAQTLEAGLEGVLIHFYLEEPPDVDFPAGVIPADLPFDAFTESDPPGRMTGVFLLLGTVDASVPFSGKIVKEHSLIRAVLIPVLIEDTRAAEPAFLLYSLGLDNSLLRRLQQANGHQVGRALESYESSLLADSTAQIELRGGGSGENWSILVRSSDQRQFDLPFRKVRVLSGDSQNVVFTLQGSYQRGRYRDENLVALLQEIDLATPRFLDNQIFIINCLLKSE